MLLAVLFCINYLWLRGCGSTAAEKGAAPAFFAVETQAACSRCNTRRHPRTLSIVAIPWRGC